MESSRCVIKNLTCLLKTLQYVIRQHNNITINPLALELDICSLAHHLCKMLIFYEPRREALGNTRHFVEK